MSKHESPKPTLPSMPSGDMDILTATEETALAECEVIIERGKGTFLQVADALIKIRDGRLYRRDHATFEDYCWARWQFSRQRAYQLHDRRPGRQGMSTWG